MGLPNDNVKEWEISSDFCLAGKPHSLTSQAASPWIIPQAQPSQASCKPSLRSGDPRTEQVVLCITPFKALAEQYL